MVGVPEMAEDGNLALDYEKDVRELPDRLRENAKDGWGLKVSLTSYEAMRLADDIERGVKARS